MARPGYALFARMQATSPAYSTLYDYHTAPQIIRSCEPNASTDTFVSRDKWCPCTYSYWYYTSRACDQQHRAPSASNIQSSSGANIQNIWSTCGIRSIALPYTTRRVLFPQLFWYSHTSECVAVKRCRYHAIRESVVCTWYVS